MSCRQQQAPPQSRCSKDVTAHPHRPGVRPDHPCPVPACSGQPLPGKRRFSSPLRNRISRGEAGATQSLRKAFFCSLQPSCVHYRERPRDRSVSIPAHFASILVPFPHRETCSLTKEQTNPLYQYFSTRSMTRACHIYRSHLSPDLHTDLYPDKEAQSTHGIKTRRSHRPHLMCKVDEHQR